MPSAADEVGFGFMRESFLAYMLAMNPQFRVGNWHRLLAEKLEAVERGDIRRLIICVPPRHGKSMMCSEGFPAWFMGKDGRRQVIHVTYGQALSNSFGRKVRNQLQEPTFQLAFPECSLAQDSQSVQEFNTNQNGRYVATGAGGSVTGKGADLLLIDDPHKNRQEAESKLIRDTIVDGFKADLATRLMPGGRIVLIQTRWHPDDLAGYLIENEGDKWEVISLPALAEDSDPLGRVYGDALWPEQYNEEALEDIRRSVGEREFAALYQQRPVPAAGNLVRRNWFQYGAAPAGLQICLGVDLAISSKETADYTAIAALGKDAFGKIHIIDTVRDRLTFSETLALIQMMAAKHRPASIAIEQVQFQAAVVQELLRTTNLPVKGVRPKGDKVTRFQPLLVRYEQGMVYHCGLPSWFEDELLLFPASPNDDIVDACSLAFSAFEDLQHNGPRIRPWEVESPQIDFEAGY